MVDPLADWLRVSEAQGSLLAVSRLPSRWGVAIDGSENAAFHLLMRGAAELCVGEEVVSMAEGDLVVLPHGEPHVLRSDAGAPVFAIATPPPAPAEIPRPNALLCGHYAAGRGSTGSVWRGLPRIILVPAAAQAGERGLAQVIQLLRAEVLDEPQEGAEPLLSSLLDALMIYALRAWSREAACGGAWLGALRDPGLSQALRAVHQSPEAAWTVEELARVAGMSRAAFARRFRDRIGEAPMAYVARWRIALAARLLTDRVLSVGEVAARVGYESEFAFNRAFKRQTGSAPGRYRRGEARGGPRPPDTQG